jgi:[calcium/calmodulin-dependent protein kinase] kinase
MGRLMVVMKAARRFKQLLTRRRPELMEGIFGSSSRFVQPPQSINPIWQSHSGDLENRKPTEYALATEGIHRDIEISDDLKKLPMRIDTVAIHESDTTWSKNEGGRATHEAEMLGKSSPLWQNEQRANSISKKSGRGQAHDPLEDTLYLGVGTGTEDPVEPGTFAAVSESPSATDFNVYERAYQEEIERIVGKQEETNRYPTLYLTRRVEHIKDWRDNEHITNHLRTKVPVAANAAFKQLIEQAKLNIESTTSMAPSRADPAPGVGLKKIIEQAKENTEAAHDKVSISASSTPQEDSTKSAIGFNKLIGKAKQHMDAANPSKTAASEAK